MSDDLRREEFEETKRRQAERERRIDAHAASFPDKWSEDAKALWEGLKLTNRRIDEMAEKYLGFKEKLNALNISDADESLLME